MQEMYGKGNIDTHSVQMPGVGKDKDTDLGLYQDGTGTIKRGETEWDHDPQ